MEQIKIPDGYQSSLNLHDTQIAIKTVKDFFQQTLESPPCAVATLWISSMIRTVFPTPAPPKRPISLLPPKEREGKG